MTIVTRGQGKTDEVTDRRTYGLTDRPTDIATQRAAITDRNWSIMTIKLRGYRMSL